eukprot:gene4136-4428_t
MEFNYEFDCPQYYYDLSKHSRDSNNFRSFPMIIDEPKHLNPNESVIDDWFLVAHEEPPKAPSDELFFAELEKREETNQRKSKPSTENATSYHSRLSTQQADNKRKRSISERSVTPSKQREAMTTTSVTASHGGLGSKPLRNKSLLSNPVSNNGLKRGLSPGRSITNNRDQENVQNTVSTHLLQTGAQKISFNEESKGLIKDSVEQPEKRRKTSAISSGASRNITTPSTSSTLTTNSSSASIQTRSKTSQLSKPAQSLATSTNKSTKSSSSVASKTTKTGPITSKTSALGKAKTNTISNNMIEDKSIEEMLKEHNAKFTPVPVYEPLKHSFRDVRKWERLNGKLWNDLRPEEREKVNQEITMLKNANLL